MGPTKSISQALEGRYFNLAVDLGCGPGPHGEVIKPHVGHLIGVDHDYGRLNVALEFSDYDEIVWSDVREYELPPETEAVFMFEVIEHLTKEDGWKLLNRISHVPFVLLSTPEIFFTAFTSMFDGHISLWKPEEFINLGYKVILTNYDFPASLRGVKAILAVKEAIR